MVVAAVFWGRQWSGGIRDKGATTISVGYPVKGHLRLYSECQVCARQ